MGEHVAMVHYLDDPSATPTRSIVGVEIGFLRAKIRGMKVRIIKLAARTACRGFRRFIGVGRPLDVMHGVALTGRVNRASLLVSTESGKRILAKLRSGIESRGRRLITAAPLATEAQS